jgi:hypothetical protein
LAVAGSASACGPAHPRIETPQAAEIPDIPDSGFKRVDEWTFVDLDLPLTPVEQQLKRHFERVFSNARHSSAYQCFAREVASFYDKHTAFPDQNLGMDMMGRCRAPTVGKFGNRIYYSDGTLLDSPLSDENLADMSQKLVEGLPEFTTFGITARALGPNVLVILETASPQASINIGEPDASRNVLIEGEVVGDLQNVSAVINHGVAGSSFCEPAQDVALPRYRFRCAMALGDSEAWVTLSSAGPDGWDTLLSTLPVHEADWIPPSSYQRAAPALSDQLDTRQALHSAINQLRIEQGKHELDPAAEQSDFIEPIYERMFAGWADDNLPLRARILRGERVSGRVAAANVATGIAFDGDASDWLVWILKCPRLRASVMSDAFNQLAIATHGAPRVGFGAAAAVYRVLTAEDDSAWTEALAASIAKKRGKLRTKLLDNPPEIEALADEIAAGAPPRKALQAALQRANLSSKRDRYLEGAFVPLSKDGLDSLPTLLVDTKELDYGIVVVHLPDVATGWYTPIAVVWFVSSPPVGPLARRASASENRSGDRPQPRASSL